MASYAGDNSHVKDHSMEKMMRSVLAVPLIVLLTAIFANPAMSAQHLDEFRQAKAKFYFPVSPNVVPTAVAKLRHEMLMGLITNNRWAWFASDSRRSADQEELEKNCHDNPVTFTRLSDYSFSLESNAGGRPVKDVYISDSGTQYNVRRDFEADLKFYSSLGYEGQKDLFLANTLHNANQVVTVIQLSQKVLMTINDGVPLLLARCEQ
ncbi:hypothetical protein [Rhizobium sp. NPDC090279]|uniref:hypothetical protein n=1 Tax=Rhizobium sp. NPDC090279 TaxID=3364499 RepID=UPI00383A2F11